MRIAGIQLDIAWQHPAANLDRLDRAWLPAAVACEVDLVVLPEMFATGFSMDVERIAEDVDGPIARWMADRAAEHSVWIAGSVAAREHGHVRNRLVLAGPTGELHRYDKRHPFSYAGEDRCFAAGDELLTVWIDGVRVTPAVCYDLRFADDFWMAGPDTDAFVVVANWPTARREHWQTLLRARAIENQCYVVGVNRVGDADGLDHVGDSAVVDPLGATVAQAAHHETMILADIDADRVASVRCLYPFLSDRRPSPQRRVVGLPRDAATERS